MEAIIKAESPENAIEESRFIIRCQVPEVYDITEFELELHHITDVREEAASWLNIAFV